MRFSRLQRVLCYSSNASHASTTRHSSVSTGMQSKTILQKCHVRRPEICHADRKDLHVSKVRADTMRVERLFHSQVDIGRWSSNRCLFQLGHVVVSLTNINQTVFTVYSVHAVLLVSYGIMNTYNSRYMLYICERNSSNLESQMAFNHRDSHIQNDSIKYLNEVMAPRSSNHQWRSAISFFANKYA